MKTKILLLIPARMGSSRFPGKPLKLIQGRPMLEHEYERANFFNRWSKLSITTCDQEIKDFCIRPIFFFGFINKKG